MITELKPNTKYKLIDKEGYLAAHCFNTQRYEEYFDGDYITTGDIYTYADGDTALIVDDVIVIEYDEIEFFEEVPKTGLVEETPDGVCLGDDTTPDVSGFGCDPFMQLKRGKDAEAMYNLLFPDYDFCQVEGDYLTALGVLRGVPRDNMTDSELRAELIDKTSSAARQELSTQEEGDCMDEQHETLYNSSEGPIGITPDIDLSGLRRIGSLNTKLKDGAAELLGVLSEDTQEYIKAIEEKLPEESVIGHMHCEYHGPSLTHPAYAGTGMLPPYTTEESVPDDQTQWTDKHYDFIYTHNLTQEEMEAGEVKIKVDPYLVCKIWGINSVEETGAGFHCLKTLSRMANQKNDIKREMLAMYKQSKRMCEVWGVDLS